MPEIRYVLPGVPEGPAAGLSAFMPVYGGYAASGRQAYKYDVTSTLGRVAIPAPTVNTQISPDAGDKAQMGTSRSSDAPQAWWPQESYQAVAVERAPVLTPDNGDTAGPRSLMPVPAVSLPKTSRRDQALLARPALLRRVRQLPWFPRLYQAPNWPGNDG